MEKIPQTKEKNISQVDKTNWNNHMLEAIGSKKPLCPTGPPEFVNIEHATIVLAEIISLAIIGRGKMKKTQYPV